jgi:hypothetical protein
MLLATVRMTKIRHHTPKEEVMKCKFCGKEVTLVPSAKERAKKFGGKPSDYTKIFTTHANCTLKYRDGAKS